MNAERLRAIRTSASAAAPALALLLVLLHAPAPAALGHHLLLHHVDDLVWDAQVLDGAASDVALWHPPKLVTILHTDANTHTRAHTQNLCALYCHLVEEERPGNSGTHRNCCH